MNFYIGDEVITMTSKNFKNGYVPKGSTGRISYISTHLGEQTLYVEFENGEMYAYRNSEIRLKEE